MCNQANHPLPNPALNSIERLNRDTFRACLEALARPGSVQGIDPLFDSYLLAVASSLLYSKTRYCYQGNQADFHLVEAMTGATPSLPPVSHYLFADVPSAELFEQACSGSIEQPESSATCIFSCNGTQETAVFLRGPGVKEKLRTNLPLDVAFIKRLIHKRPPFPLGADLFLVSDRGKIIGLPRTTKIEVQQ